MTQPRAHKEGVWQEDPKPTFMPEVSDAAKITVKKTFFKHEVTVKGNCPYCFGETEFVYSMKVIPSMLGATVGQGHGEVDITVACRCSHEHEGAPPGELGCGQSWTITLQEN